MASAFGGLSANFYCAVRSPYLTDSILIDWPGTAASYESYDRQRPKTPTRRMADVLFCQ